MTQPSASEGESVLGSFWTAANVLSILRMILGIPVFIVLLTRGPGDWIVVALVALAVVTDWMDGKVARWSDTVSEWGKILDPLADKITAALAILALAMRGDTVIAWWFLALIVIRDGLIVAGATRMSLRRRQVFMSLRSGKVAVAFLALLVAAVVLQADPPIPETLLWISTGLLVYSFVRYLFRYIRYMRSEKAGHGVKGEEAGHSGSPVGPEMESGS